MRQLPSVRHRSTMDAPVPGVDSKICEFERLIEDLAFLVVRQHRHNQTMRSRKSDTSERAQGDYLS